MAKVDGGLHGNPKGSVGGITYSEARGREGKVTTARQKVSPSNPQTGAQQDQRNAFRHAQNLIQDLGQEIYSNDFNRAVGDLPGFQALQSVMTDVTDQDGLVSVPDTINIGSLDGLVNPSLTVSETTPNVSLSYDADTGELGTAQDEVVAAAFKASLESDDSRLVAKSVAQTTRDSGPVDMDLGIAAGDEVIVMHYVRGADTADGLLSPASFLSGTV